MDLSVLFYYNKKKKERARNQKVKIGTVQVKNIAEKGEEMGYNTNHAKKFTQREGKRRLRKRRKMACTLCTAVLLCGCGVKEEYPQTEKSAVPVIRMGTITSAWRDEEDLEEINQELGDLTEKKAGFRLELVWIDPLDFEKYVYGLTAQALDIFVLYDRDYYRSYIEKGLILGIEEYLDQYGSNILDVITIPKEELYENDGKIYGIPKPMPDINTNGILMKTSFVEKYDMDITSIKSMEDMETFLKIIKENEPDVTPIVSHQVTSGIISRQPIGDVLDRMLSMVYFDDETLTVQNLYETPEYEQQCRLIRRWYKEGYINPDILTTCESGRRQVYNGDAFCSEFVIRPDEVEYEQAIYGDDITIIPFDRQPVLTTNGVWEIMWCVSSSTEYPKESVKAIDLIYSDEELTDLLLYGAEGKDYVILDDGSIDFPEPYSMENAPYFNKTKWIFNRYLSKRWHGVSENINEKMIRFNESAVISPAYGFRLDYSKITVDLTPIRALIEEYERKLGCGVLDVETALPEFQKKLRENGSEELIAQVQEQVNQWKQQIGK